MSEKYGHLRGRRIVVTRRGEQAEETCRQLEALGATAIRMPTIAIEPVADLAPLKAALAREPAYLVVTSANAVAPLIAALGHGGRGSARLCCIGPATRRRLEEAGLHVDLEAHDHRAEGLVELLSGRLRAGERVLLPTARAARDVLPTGLRALGAEVEVIVVYDTVLPPESEWLHGLEALRRFEVDAMLFSSPSTAQHFARIAGDEAVSLLAPVRVAAIGSVTARACEKLGFEVAVMPARYTFAALIEALNDHWKSG